MIAVGVATFSAALPPRPQAQSPHAAFATMHIGGKYFPRDAANSKYTILSMYIYTAIASKGEAPAAGLATFGWFEPGEIKLLHYVEYLPSLMHAGGRRNVKPAKWPL